MMERDGGREGGGRGDIVQLLIPVLGIFQEEEQQREIDNLLRKTRNYSLTLVKKRIHKPTAV